MESYTEQQFYDAIEKGDHAFLTEVQTAIAKFQKELGNYNGLVATGAYDALRHMTKPVEPEFIRRFNSANERFHGERFEVNKLVSRIQSMRMTHPERQKLTEELYTKYGKTLDGIRKTEEMTNIALNNLKNDAKDHVSQTYPSTSPILRNIIIQNANDFGITPAQVQELKENGDIKKVLRERNVHLAPYGHGRIMYQNQYWILTRDQDAMMQKALVDYMPGVFGGDKWAAYMNGRHSHFPFSGMGMHELDNVLKLEECMWEQYLAQMERDYIASREGAVRYNVSKSVDTAMKIDKHGLTGLF